MTIYFKTFKINAKQFIKAMLIISLTISLMALAVDIFCFPECYANTWRYQLQNEIKAGNEKSIEYYQRHYVEKGRRLF